MTTGQTLTERILQRIEEFPRHGETVGYWVHGALRAILALHPEENGHCATCVEPVLDGTPETRAYERFPCPTVREIMDWINFPSWETAHEVVSALIEDSLAVDGARPLTVLRRAEQDRAGAFAFEAVYPAAGVMLHLPAKPLNRLRPGPDGEIKYLSRVQINGSEWVWPSAVEVLARGSRLYASTSGAPL